MLGSMGTFSNNMELFIIIFFSPKCSVVTLSNAAGIACKKSGFITGSSGDKYFQLYKGGLLGRIFQKRNSLIQGSAQNL